MEARRRRVGIFKISQLERVTGVEPVYPACPLKSLYEFRRIRLSVSTFGGEGIIGAGEGTRTLDLFLGRETCYHYTTPA